MGRHSAPDDDSDVAVVTGVADAADVADVAGGADAVATQPVPSDFAAGMLVLPRGRHARSEDGWIETDASEAAAAPAEVDRPGPRLPIEPGTRGDLQLLRQSASLRARCAAAVVVPFVLYTIVLVAIKRTDVYLIWFWIPTVVAGVLIGTFLDAAHRKLRSRAE